MKQSTKSLVLFLAIGLVFASPAEAMFRKGGGDFGRFVRALQGDNQAAKGLPGDVRKVALAISGDDDAREKLRADWANAKAKLAKLLGKNTEEATVAGAGSSGITTGTGEPTQADLAEIMSRISALEAARPATAPEPDAALRARIAALEAELATRSAAAAPTAASATAPKDGGFDPEEIAAAIAASLTDAPSGVAAPAPAAATATGPAEDPTGPSTASSHTVTDPAPLSLSSMVAPTPPPVAIVDPAVQALLDSQASEIAALRAALAAAQAPSSTAPAPSPEELSAASALTLPGPGTAPRRDDGTLGSHW